MTSPALEEFIERARAVTIDEAADRLGLKRSGTRHENAGPCPVCGGTDGFAFNTQKNAWNCRAAGQGGRDAISLAEHVLGLDVRHRAGFLAVCEAVTGEAAPDPEQGESEEEKTARLARLATQRAANEAKAAARDKAANAFRAKEIAKARGKWERAGPIGGTHAARYLELRAGYQPQTGGLLRFDPALDYWVGEARAAVVIHTGPAMIAPFVGADGQIIGCHQTWVDLARGPKFRPDLGLDTKGDPWPTKKMRGSKQGGFIPVAGYALLHNTSIVAPKYGPPATRMVAGEGIETVLAVAYAERFRRDTLYIASGDLGNLAGKADHASDFFHPTLTLVDKAGRTRPKNIGGPVPDFSSPAMPVPDAITTLILLADGDSERVWTASMMARAKARHSKEGRLVVVVWPGIHGDFADHLGKAPETETA